MITSYHQRNITFNTANYYSEICSEVIIVDEEKTYLSKSDIETLKNKNIEYIGYKSVTNQLSIKSIYEKRLIAAINSNKDMWFIQIMMKDTHTMVY